MLTACWGAMLWLGTHPFRTFLLSWVICAGVSRIPIAGGWRRWMAPLATSGSVVAVLTLLTFALWYVTQPTYYDWVEPSMTSLGWLWLRGAELYPDAASSARYGQLYGPATYMIQAAVLRVFGPSEVASKATGLVALLLALACLYWACRRHASEMMCCWLLGVAALICLWFGNTSFWNRPDSYLLFAVSAGALACESRSARAAIGGVTVALAACLDLKVTGAIYFLPIVVVIWRRFGAPVVAASLAAAGLLAFVPFLLPLLSFRGFATLHELYSHHGLSWLMLGNNLKFAGILVALLAPAALMPHGLATTEFVASITAITAIAVIAAKPGAGVHHFLPLVAVVLWQVSRVLSSERPIVAGLFLLDVYVAAGVTFGLVAPASVGTIVKSVRDLDQSGLHREVRSFAANRDVSRVALAYGSDAKASFAIPELLFRGGPMAFDVVTVIDQQFAGATMPAAAIDAVRACTMDAWLVPRGETPFTVPNPYFGGSMTVSFDQDFRDAFHAAYIRKTPATRSLDLWVCRTRP
jgi:hypothetical protein